MGYNPNKRDIVYYVLASDVVNRPAWEICDTAHASIEGNQLDGASTRGGRRRHAEP